VRTVHPPHSFAHRIHRFRVPWFPVTGGEYRLRPPRPPMTVTLRLRGEAGPAPTTTPRGVRGRVTARWTARTLLARPPVPHRGRTPLREHGTGCWLRRPLLTPHAPQTVEGERHG
jgi:hypothetical protein